MHTADFTLPIEHCTQHRSHSSNCSLQSTHIKLHTAHCTLHTAYWTPPNAQCTLHTALWTLNNVHWTLHTVYCSLLIAHCTLHQGQAYTGRSEVKGEKPWGETNREVGFTRDRWQGGSRLVAGLDVITISQFISLTKTHTMFDLKKKMFLSQI